MSAMSYARIVLWGHTITYPFAHEPVTADLSWRLAVQVISVLAVPLIFEYLAWADRRQRAQQREAA
jgi:hypothetical protein